MTDVPDPQPRLRQLAHRSLPQAARAARPAPEASVDEDRSTIWLAIEAGVYGPGRDKRPAAYEALERFAARLREAERERDEARRAMQYYCGRAQDAERERDDLFHAFHKARALLGSGEGQEQT